MTSRPLALVLLFGATLLAACTQEASFTRASAAQVAACRIRADQVYDRQNRADLYRSDSYAGGTRDAMFSSTGRSM